MPNQEICYAGEGKMQRQESVIEGLYSRKKGLEAQLADVNAAINALEQHPEVADVLTLLGKVGRY